MNKYSIKQVSFLGFLIFLITIVLSGGFIFHYIKTIEELYKKNEIYNTIYNNMFEFKYNTERLLTTTNLNHQKRIWEDSHKKLHKILVQEIVLPRISEFRAVVDSESEKISKKLEHKLFQATNTMEKSILRRLGEGLNSNKTSDYYLLITEFKNSIDYLTQYEEFLLDELNEIKIKQQKNIYKQLKETKVTFAVVIFLIFIISSILSFIIFKFVTKIEKKLLSTRNKLEDTLDEANTILNTSMESIMIAKNGICVDVNEETLRKFGYQFKDELIGKPTTIFIAPDSHELILLKKSMNDIEPYEANCITKDNRIFPVLIKGYNFINKKGETIRVSAIVDLTEIKSRDEMLFQQSKMAALGEMLENIAHQWRQPLSVITTSATGIQVKKAFGNSTQESEDKSLDLIIKSAQHLSETIDDFRNFFKPNIEKRKFIISEAIDKSLGLLSSKLQHRSIEIIKDMSSIEILGYENEFIQAFMNILNNAKDAFEETEIERKLIFITLKQNEQNIVINIKDNAGGISDDILPHIFEGHFTTKGDKDGTGIGLYMTKMIIEKLNANIIAKTEKYEYDGLKYRGASFYITI
jgi:PAS domain S-box-containing protein